MEWRNIALLILALGVCPTPARAEVPALPAPPPSPVPLAAGDVEMVTKIDAALRNAAKEGPAKEKRDEMAALLVESVIERALAAVQRSRVERWVGDGKDDLALDFI